MLIFASGCTETDKPNENLKTSSINESVNDSSNTHNTQITSNDLKEKIDEFKQNDIKKEEFIQIGKINVPEEIVDFLDYFPLGKNIRYITLSGDGKQAWLNTFEEGTVLLDNESDYGREYFLKGKAVVFSNGELDDMTYKIYAFNLEDDEIVNYGIIKSNGEIRWNTYPVIEYPLTFEFGEEYIFDNSDEIANDFTKIRAIGVTDVTVSGQLFENCLVLEKEVVKEIVDLNKTIIKSKEYYAPNLGLIYYEHDYIWEDYTINEKTNTHQFEFFAEMDGPTKKTMKLIN